jgi:hypothetical protein
MSSPFFSKDNEGVLQRVLYNDICRRYGDTLNEKQATRLMKTVTYYMGEVHRVHGDKPIHFLNKEVLTVVLPDYVSYLERSERAPRSAVSDIEVGPGQQGQEQSEVRQIQDIDNAFTALQTQRQDTKVKPQMQDFRVSLSEEPPLSMELFERMKKEREEAALVVLQVPSAQKNLNTFVEASDTFLQGSRRAKEDAEAMFAEQERKKLEQRANVSMPVPPDMRSLFTNANVAAGNPTVAPPGSRETLANLPQAMLTREPDILSYRETETNLFLYSGDRDWTANSTESRYNFTTIFDPAGLSGNASFQTTTVPTRFRNIIRIEFIKAIIPGESFDPLVVKTGAAAYQANTSINALSFPYIQVRIPELETNSYGTNQGITSSFALVQYDANWINDSTLGSQRGYFAMIPKFMKCQKVYTTPLSTLQRLSIQLQRPDGTILSSTPDTLDIKYVYPSIAVNSTLYPPVNVANTVYRQDPTIEANGSAYYWIQTNTYFNVASFAVGDRVLLKNIAWTTSPINPAGAQLAQVSAISQFLQRTSGHIVVALGTVTGGGTTATFSDTNTQGYVNAFLVRGAFPDPTTGVFTASPPGGINDSPTATVGSSANYLINNQLISGRVLNQSHQVHVALRIITRDIDSTGILRTDNL